MAHKELGAQLLARVRDDLEEYGSVEQMPQMEGRQMVMVIGHRRKSNALVRWHRGVTKKVSNGS